MPRKESNFTCSDTALKRQEPSLAIGLRYKFKWDRNSSIALSVKLLALLFVALPVPGFFLRLMFGGAIFTEQDF